ncbi:MAG: Ldh family oxidoreductase [Armatimonadetes bacterium]|nr:Ldh family oxidoreductase [Armatimonadota bacterium]
MAVEVKEADIRDQVFTVEFLRNVGMELFGAVGAPADEALIVVNELVDASLMGLDSHGVMRYVWYTEEVLNGNVKPSAPIRIVKETPNTAVVDCGFNWGPVGASRMVEIVCEKAAISNLACAVSINNHHVARLGAWVQRIAERGMFGFATANSHKQGQAVVPWGGMEGRLAPNPLAFAAPTSGLPVVLDMSTSMIAEGKIRLLKHQDKDIPPRCVIDSNGNPTTDPSAFFGPPKGHILPFGSELGYKGFGLAVMVEILSASLAGVPSNVEQPYCNGFCLLAINPDAFCGRERFRELVDELSAYITSAPPAPGFSEVVMPGTLDFRMYEKRLVEGIPLAADTWRKIVQLGQKVGVDIV